MEKEYLFAYGTLLDERNEFGAYLIRNCIFHTKGRFRGRLYDIGEYPGAIADNNSLGYVYGSIYVTYNTKRVLEYLDDYEGFDPEQHQLNLFIREMVAIESSQGLINCWCYFYNLPTEQLKLILSGDYLAYKGLV